MVVQLEGRVTHQTISRQVPFSPESRSWFPVFLFVLQILWAKVAPTGAWLRACGGRPNDNHAIWK
jgi:hypothetical protein